MDAQKSTDENSNNDSCPEQERKHKMSDWHESMLESLILYFEPNQDILGLILIGSLSKPEFHYDYWSDIDILVVVKNNSIDKFFPTVEWVTTFGPVYAYSQSADDFKYTTRICYEDFNRIDFVITTEENLARTDHWIRVPFFSERKILFSRSTVIDKIANQEYVKQKVSPPTEDQFLAMVRDFRFKSMLAVYKVVRNDLLIALHLAQDLVRDCSVLGMMLRDRATGTNIHKHGGIGNKLVAQLENTQKPFTSTGILDGIKASNEIFEKLACEWSDTYQENRQLLFNWIERARLEVRE